MARPKINTIYASAEKLRENARIEAALGDGVVCDRCGATLATYHDQCSADLADRCPGFEAIERAAKST